jgi:uncharacterized protein YukE
MSDFQVRPGELSDLVGGFQGLLGELQQLSGQVGTGNAAAAGTPDLEAAIAEFLGRWSGGLDRLNVSLGQLSARLAAAADAFEATDQRTASAFSS